MTVVVGRVRACPVLDIRLVVLSHNLGRGAAGAAILNAELLAHGGYITERSVAASKSAREPQPSIGHRH